LSNNSALVLPTSQAAAYAGPSGFAVSKTVVGVILPLQSLPAVLTILRADAKVTQRVAGAIRPLQQLSITDPFVTALNGSAFASSFKDIAIDEIGRDVKYVRQIRQRFCNLLRRGGETDIPIWLTVREYNMKIGGTRQCCDH